MKGQVILGQITKFKIISQNHAYLIHFRLSSQKCHLSLRTAIKMPNVAFQKLALSPLPFLTITQPKMKILLWNCVYLLVVCSFISYVSVFQMTSNFWILYAFIFEKSKFSVFGAKIEKIFKIRDSHLYSVHFTSFGVCRLRFTSTLYILCRSLRSNIYDFVSMMSMWHGDG